MCTYVYTVYPLLVKIKFTELTLDDGYMYNLVCNVNPSSVIIYYVLQLCNGLVYSWVWPHPAAILLYYVSQYLLCTAVEEQYFCCASFICWANSQNNQESDACYVRPC